MASEPETLDDGHGQAVTTADELIDPYLKAREDLLKKINGRWSELERSKSVFAFTILLDKPTNVPLRSLCRPWM